MLSSRERPEQTAGDAWGASKSEEEGEGGGSMKKITRRGAPALVAALAFLGDGCLEITKSVTEGPPPVPSPRLVSVRVEYRQPNGCVNVVNPCNTRVVFFGSWMQPGGEVLLSQNPGTYVWTGVVLNVPVNFPPREQPYLVRVFDPHLTETPTGGVTASRLVVGGQMITFFDQPGTTAESGVIFIDDNGIGRNPF